MVVSQMRGFWLVLLLLGGGGVGTALAKPAAIAKMPTKRPADYEVGKRLWKQSCWQCHGEAGAGDGPAAAALIGGVPSLEGKIRGENFDALIKVVRDGRSRMPSYSEDIDDHDARRVLEYLRDTMEGRGPPTEGGEPAAGGDAPGEAAEGQ